MDWRTDIYQTGALSYELLTDTKPFTGDPARLVFDIIAKDPKHPSDLNRIIPRPMGDAIMRSLNKDKKKRFQDASAFREALG